MTTKAEMKKTTDEATGKANGDLPHSARPDYRLIQAKDLQPSPTNPRRRIDETSIESLAASIGSQGILEPLIVRAKDKKFEIVCGERRYRAASVAKVSEIPCLVRELTDEQVLDIQIHENLHREDIHPMDEAYGYKFLQEKLGCDIPELAVRVGKSEGYVLNRLKLNSLIKEAQKDIDDGHLPLVYGLEIAKYPPDTQKHVYGAVYQKEGTYKGNNYVQVPLKGQMIPWKAFTEWINTNIHRRLAKAPFDPKATDLRPDGLACVNCPERTGASVSLFEPNQVGKNDACLNPACFQLKAENLVLNNRKKIAELAKIEPSEVPIVRSWCYSDGQDYLGTQSAAVISGSKRGKDAKKCDRAVSAIDIEADNFAQTVQVCLKSSKCKIHWPEAKAPSKPGSQNGKPSETAGNERLEAHRSRREEIWNAKVAEAVRVRVFKQAAESFEKSFAITESGKDLLAQLIVRFWTMTSSGDNNTLNKVIKPLLADWIGGAKDASHSNIHDGPSGVEAVKQLKRPLQYRLLFVLVHGNKGSIGFGNIYRSQKEVKELAAEFKVDYSLLDAEVRLEFSSKKHREVHRLYLDDVRAKSKNAKVPRLFSESWTPAE